MGSTSHCLEVGEDFPHGDEGVICLVPLEISDPRVFYHTEDKFFSLALCGFKCCVVAAPGLVYGLLSNAERCLLVVVDRRILNSGLARLGGSGGVVRRVGCRVLYDPDEVVYPVFLVVRYDKEDL